MRLISFRMCVRSDLWDSGMWRLRASKPTFFASLSRMTLTLSLNLFFESSAQMRVPSRICGV